jgi:hypothetical protein
VHQLDMVEAGWMEVGGEGRAWDCTAVDAVAQALAIPFACRR